MLFQQLQCRVLLADAAADTGRTWSARGRCVQADSELFFPLRDGFGIEARVICRSCVVRLPCLAYAVIADERYGIWGGLDARERHNLQRRMQRASDAANVSARNAG
ncbi:MAG TPA: WhiB family transcriptional regulator [Trebonia sp.]|nr:WhiB family transcriptional regulator [Trebonia sp.]